MCPLVVCRVLPNVISICYPSSVGLAAAWFLLIGKIGVTDKYVYERDVEQEMQFFHPCQLSHDLPVIGGA